MKFQIRSHVLILSLALTLTHASTALAYKPVLSLIGKYETKNPNGYRDLNTVIGKSMAQKADAQAEMLPFYFMAPLTSNTELPSDVTNSKAETTASPAILFQYRQSNAQGKNKKPIQNQIGLRMLVVDGSQSRTEISSLVAQTGILQTGDILLSFRPEWYQTLRYSHVQLGVSHAGVAYVGKGSDGKNYIYNLDMPLDTDTVGADKKSTLSSKHYLEAPTVHVVRPRNLTETQRSNLLRWLIRLREQSKKFYGSQMKFNQDYSAPKFNPKSTEPYDFVRDLGRLALGQNLGKELTMYCSEFAYSVLALRNCDPVKDADAFTGQQVPSCIEPIFKPMPVLGKIAWTKQTDELKDPNLDVGLADGPALLATTYTQGIASAETRDRLLQKMFKEASGHKEHISSGHVAVEQGLSALDPEDPNHMDLKPGFFGHLLRYYQASSRSGQEALLPQNPQTFDHLGVALSKIKSPLEIAPVFDQLSNSGEFTEAQRDYYLYNQVQKPNYSPTAFMVHAVTPDAFSNKAMEYVVTLVYAPKAAYNQLLNAGRKAKF